MPEFIIQDVRGLAVGRVYLHNERHVNYITENPEQWTITPQVVRHYQADPQRKLRSFLLQPIPAQERWVHVD